MNSEMTRHYTLLVEFLSRMLGLDYEIVLYDLEQKQPSVIAIANGYISGCGVGAPLTNALVQLISDKAYENNNWKTNYQGVAANGKMLRCSTFFVKDEHASTVGLLSINFDDSRYRTLSESVFQLCHPDEYAMRSISINTISLPEQSLETPLQKTFSSSISTTIDEALESVLDADALSASRLNQAKRLKVIQELDKNGVFALKGAIPVVAEKLSCSQASIYRYLSKIHQE